MTLHTLTTAVGQVLSATEDGPALYTIDHDRAQRPSQPWLLTDESAKWEAWSFRTLEGAQFYALHLEAERTRS